MSSPRKRRSLRILKTPGNATNPRIVLMNVKDMPVAAPMETPLHQKTLRKWNLPGSSRAKNFKTPSQIYGGQQSSPNVSSPRILHRHHQQASSNDSSPRILHRQQISPAGSSVSGPSTLSKDQKRPRRQKSSTPKIRVKNLSAVMNETCNDIEPESEENNEENVSIQPGVVSRADLVLPETPTDAQGSEDITIIHGGYEIPYTENINDYEIMGEIELETIGEQSRGEQLVARRVSYHQLEIMWEALNCHRELALGFNKTAQARELSRRMWKDIAIKLNSQSDGAVKDWKGWCKYWNDYKSKLKKVSAASARSHQQTGGGPSSVKPMTDVEKKFIQMFRNNCGVGSAGVRVEPFMGETESKTASDVGSKIILISDPDLVPATTELPTGPSWRMTTVPHSQTESVLPPPQSPPSPIAAMNAPPPRQVRRATQQSTARGSERRRLRRDPPISANTARRMLIREVQRRNGNDERNAQLLRQLVDEMKQIKEILCRALGTLTDDE